MGAGARDCALMGGGMKAPRSGRPECTDAVCPLMEERLESSCMSRAPAHAECDCGELTVPLAPMVLPPMMLPPIVLPPIALPPGGPIVLPVCIDETDDPPSLAAQFTQSQHWTVTREDCIGL